MPTVGADHPVKIHQLPTVEACVTQLVLAVGAEHKALLDSALATRARATIMQVLQHGLLSQ